MAKFLTSLTSNPAFTFQLSTGLFADLDPYGFDPDGMKEELYKDRPEYQGILDGMMEDCGYDECVAAIRASLPEDIEVALPPDSFEDDCLG